VSVDRPENLDVEVLFEEHRFNFDPHGLVTHTIHRIYRTLTQDGVSSWGGIEASYAAWFQETPKMRARVITPEGFEHWLDPKTLVEVGSGSSSNAMYSDVRTVKGPLPSLRPGSVVEEWSEIKDRVPYFAAGSSYRHWLYVSTFTQTHRVVLSAPNGLPLRYVLRGGAKPPTVTTQGNRRTWTFTEHNGLPLRQFPPATSPEIAVVPMIEFSTGRSWEEVSRAYAKVVANQIAGFDAKSLSDTLVLPEDNVASKAAKLLSFLSKNQSYSFLHTLATLYAETGNYKRARDTLFRALNTLEGQQVPDSAWYTLGRIAEGIGLGDASQALYRRVKKPNDPGRYSSWELARRRLKQATTH
jgi:hypothetical protein